MGVRFLSAVLTLCLLLTFVPGHVLAKEAAAQDISGIELVTAIDGFPGKNALFDGRLRSGPTSAVNASITLEYADGMGSLYFLFDNLSGHR